MVPSLPRIRHPLTESDVDSPKPRLREERSGLVGGSTGLNHDPDEIVRNQHERVHHTCQMQRLERPYIGRRDHDDCPRVLKPKLKSLLLLDPLDDLMSPHDLDGVRVRPGPDSDPVSSDHNSTTARAPAGHGGYVPRRKLEIPNWSGVNGEGLGELGGGAKRGGVEVGGGRGGEEEQEDQP